MALNGHWNLMKIDAKRKTNSSTNESKVLIFYWSSKEWLRNLNFWDFNQSKCFQWLKSSLDDKSSSDYLFQSKISLRKFFWIREL